MEGQTFTGPVRLCGVQGFADRRNDIVYCQPIQRSDCPSVTIFFPGDVQDFTESMQTHRDNKNYIIWNLENTALILQTKFRDNHVMVVRPARMEFRTFSCFLNFVPSNKCGVPDHTPTNNALQHLHRLILNVSERLREMPNCDIRDAIEVSRRAIVLGDIVENGENIPEIPDDCLEQLKEQSKELRTAKIKLIGFSKGCVVLNQLLYEFHYCQTLTPDNNDDLGIISRISDMYWLDGGHNGGKNTWITSKSLLETVGRLGINLHVHVTPYQIRDDRRPWIKKEEKQFHETLAKLGANIEHEVHFENVQPNLLLHFDVLNEFKK